MRIEDVLTSLIFLGCCIEPCGSRVTCDPPPTDTDQDYLVEIRSKGAVARVVKDLDASGFKWEGNEHYEVAAAGDFMSWRRGNTNLIVTANSIFADRHRAATFVCKRLNLLSKDDRIALFQAVLYGNQWAGKKASPPLGVDLVF